MQEKTDKWRQIELVNKNPKIFAFAKQNQFSRKVWTVKIARLIKTKTRTSHVLFLYHNTADACLV